MINIDIERIERSIKSITNLRQVQSTYRWIRLLELRYGATDVANNLRDKLREVQL